MIKHLPAAIYLRVSGKLQAGPDRFGLASQEHDARTYAARLGLQVARVYVDQITGVSSDRVQFQELLQDAPAYSAVILGVQDRLARDVPLSYAMLGALQDAGLKVYSAGEGALDLEDDSSALGFGIRAVIADQERRRITKRMYGGMLAKVRSGRPARTINAFGWRDGQVDPEQAQWVRWIFERLESTGLTNVAYELAERGVLSPTGLPQWRRAQLVKMVHNPLYIGRYEFGRKGERVSTPVEAIVSEEQARRTQAMLRTRRKEQGRPGAKTAVLQLQGVVRCGECGRVVTTTPVRVRADGRQVAYYFCRATLRAEGATCDHRTYYRMDLLHDVAREGLQQLLSSPALIQGAVEDLTLPEQQQRRVQADLERLDAQWERWKGALRVGAITPEELATERRRIDQARAALLMTPERPVIDVQAWRDRVGQAVASLPLNEALRAAGITVLVHTGGRVTFRIRA